MKKILPLFELLLFVIFPRNGAAQDVLLDCSFGKTHAGGSGGVSIYLRNRDVNVASVQFDLLFDTDNLTVEEVNRSYRTEHISIFNWENIDVGIHVSMADSQSTIKAGAGSIAKIIIGTNFNSPIGTYDLIVTNAMLYDSLSNEIPTRTANGEFMIIHGAYLRIDSPKVLPGSIANMAGVWLDSYVFVESVQFDLNYDTYNFTVTNVEQPFISDIVFPAFSWSRIEEGIHVSLSDATLSFPSAECLASVSFDVGSDVVRDSSYYLTLDNVVLVHSSSNEVAVKVRSGSFFVPSHDVYLSIEGYEGEQGSVDNKVWILFDVSYVDVAAVKFDLLYDTNNLSISRVETTEASAAFTNIDWNNISGGTQIFMSNDGAVISHGGWRSIAYVFFDIAPDAPTGNYDLAFSGVVLLDTLNNEILTKTTDGRFHVYPKIDSMILTVVDGAGFPGSRGNVVPIHLENNRRIHGFQLDLAFDTNRLLVSDVERTPRTEHVMIHTWSWIDRGIRIVIYTEGGIHFGTGSIADISFDVYENAPLGEYGLVIDSAIVADGYGTSVATDLFDGILRVVKQGDVDGNGRVDIADIMLTVNIILGIHEPNPGEVSVADCNDDDEVNVLDVVCIVNIVIGG
ncbi:MAG: dockerin type I repeat-containing protein [bacterium]